MSPVRVPLDARIPGRLVRRYKRFLADVETADGLVTAHCPDPGSMRGLLRPGAAVRLSRSDDPHRRLSHTLEMIRSGRAWVGVHTGRANRLAERVLGAGAFPHLAGYASVRREVSDGAGSRIDFLLEEHEAGERPAWVEVKSVTLAEGSRGRFPDSVTERGRRHAEALARLSRRARAALLFVVQRCDCESVEPAEDIDPAYARALRAAARRGVEVHALRTRVTPTGIRYEGPLPVLL